MEIAPFVVTLGVSLALGLLVGLQREWAEKVIAGIRTFALVTVLGGISGMLLDDLGPWVVAAGLVGVTSLLILGNAVKLLSPEEEDPTPGITTEIAALAMYLVGVAVGLGHTLPAIVAGGIIAVLLQWRARLHGLVERLDDKELQAIFRLALIALVILPTLPNQAIGPYAVVNPFEIWLMVVLIVGISTLAYVAYKFLPERVGAVVAGLMGGLISSTATTVSTSRRARREQVRISNATLLIVISSTVVLVRVLVEIILIAPDFLLTAGPPLGVLLLLMIGISVATHRLAPPEGAEPEHEREPPSELGGAITFGLLYAVVLVAVAAAEEHFGSRGVYIAGALSGLTDMDAITLSTSRLVSAGNIDADLGWRVIVVGTMANLGFKGGAVAVLGRAALTRAVWAAFGTALAGSGLLLLLWP